jgi:putative membrane protein
VTPVLLAALVASHAVVRDPWGFHLHLAAWAGLVALVLVASGVVRHVTGRVGGVSGSRPSRRQRGWFIGAVVALALAVTWPLGDLATHWSLTALVVQRLLLTLAVAPLLLLATPSAVSAALTRPAPVDAALSFVTRPVVAVVGFSAIVLSTLLPPCVAAESTSSLWRVVIDTTLLAGGVVLWAPVMRHLPGVHRTGEVGVAAYLFVQSIVPTFLAVIYVFSHHPFYGAFAHVHRAFPVSALVDQQVAGVVAKVGTLPVLWSAAWAALARGQRADSTERDLTPLTWADVERQLERAARAERLAARPGALRSRWAARRTPRITEAEADAYEPETRWADGRQQPEPRSPTDGGTSNSP